MELNEEQKKAAAEKAEADKNAAETPKAAPKAAPKTKRHAASVKIGDKVGFVHGWKRKGTGTASVTRVNRNGTVDMELHGLEHGPGSDNAGEPQIITDAPHDPTATKPDSWHFIEE